MPELTDYELAYWDGWNDCGDLYIDAVVDMHLVRVSPNWERDEQGYWAGWNAKLALRQRELAVEYV